ncbi:MAG: putative molybdenum carrier protein [Elusimicrobia bacterium]|nr:putative molybdenum carrier protein [Elusimicrobiota bacterium]
MKSEEKFILKKIVSGGQSGVDRAALDAAIKTKIACGGYIPKGRLAEDGRINAKYPLTETYSSNYGVRTRLNIKYSCATLIIKEGELEGGTLFTFNVCKKLKKPVKIVDLQDGHIVEEIKKFIEEYFPETLNIAGPRESKKPGIYKKSLKILLKVLTKKTFLLH